MDPLTEHYYNTCLSLGLVTTSYDNMDAFHVQIGGVPYYFSRGLVPNNDCVGVTIASNKMLTNFMLRQAGVPVPESIAITRKNYEQNNWQVADIQFPVVAKPTSGTSGGRGVVCNIATKRALKKYLDSAFQRHSSICIETFKPNLQSYRVLMLNGKVIDYYMRVPCEVEGDGQSTVLQLIKQYTRDILLGKIPKRKYPPKINEETTTILKEQGLTFNSIPQKDQIVKLRYACNEALGGYFQRIDDKIIHPDNIHIMQRAAKAVELNLVGIDLLCEDISQSISTTQGYIIEMNGAPDIRAHESLRSVRPVPVTKMIIEHQMKNHPMFYLRYHLKHHWRKWLLGFGVVLGAVSTSMALMLWL